jgi:hypothetical protein
VIEKEARQSAYGLHCSGHFKKSDSGNSAIFKKWWKRFWSPAPFYKMIPLEVIHQKFLVEYLSREK